MAKYTNVRRRGNIHKLCMRTGCDLHAVVSATRKVGKMTLDVKYCEDHARQGGLIE